ncbi:MAG: zinc ribbon domain-containing protein [Betaproteobacteria bacterium]|nr:zinc ribbon domain-containing protein [Betaproteobacteria bacterium]MCL2886753.1 zinc ribbon domain-containing protein [Betaproteobacteria bacterium]
MAANQILGEVRFATLARAGEGMTQWRPMLLGFLTLLLAFAVILVGQLLGTAIGGFTGGIVVLIFALAAAIVVMGGISAVGVMLMDKARNEPARSFGDALTFGLACIPKFLLFAVVLLIAVIAFMLVAALLYLLCKIPALGAILAFVVHPLLVLAAGAALVALFWVIYPLFAPAVWSGLTFKAALANVLGIARQRLVEVVLLELVLYIIIGIISMLLFSGLVPASLALTAMAAAIIGGGGNVSSLIGMFAGGNMAGLVLGLAAMFMVVGALMVQVMIMGMNLVYLQVREGVDAADAEGALDGLIGTVRQRAEDARNRAVAAAEQVKQARAAKAEEAARRKAEEEEARLAAEETARRKAEQEATEREAARLEAEAGAMAEAEQDRRDADQQQALSCPGCHETVTPDDRFCGNCGYKLT